MGRRGFNREMTVVIGLLVSCAAVASGCGSDGSTGTTVARHVTSVASKPAPELHLEVTKPDNGAHVTADEFIVKGSVTSGARVRVAGHTVHVHGHRFTASVRIHGRGAHDVKVHATKVGWRSTETSFSVTRDLSAAELAAIAERRRLRAEAAEAAFKAEAVTIPYNQLHKDAAAYRGKRVVYRGQIFQIQEQEGLGGIMLLSVTDEGFGLWDDNIWVDYNDSIKSAENDVVTVYGVVRGSKSYQTQIGGETYVPRVAARYIDESG
jgi:hypothetical protein